MSDDEIQPSDPTPEGQTGHSTEPSDDALPGFLDDETENEWREKPSTNGVHARIADDDDTWRTHLDLTKEGEVSGTQFNAIVILKHHPDWIGVVVRDAFRDRVVMTRTAPWQPMTRPTSGHEAWTDSDTRRLQVWYARAEAITFALEKCETAVTLVAEGNERHAVRDYLRGLVWDGRPRVDALLHRYLGVEANDYTRAVSVAFLIGAVARVMKPGCQLDSLPILEGVQGSGKSSAVRILAGEWFSDSAIDFGSKDSYQQLPGVWLYELGELDALNRRDVSRVKAFISAPSDRYRPSYGRRVIDVPRQCVFIGTTNATDYLSDDTGARRFWPVRTGRIDLEALRTDRDQLWAEAVHLFDKGEAWHLSGARVVEASEEQEARRIRDPWEETIPLWLAQRPDPRKPVTTADVLRGLGVDQAEQDRPRSMRVGSVLRLIGWTRRQVRIDDVRVFLYSPPEAS